MVIVPPFLMKKLYKLHKRQKVFQVFIVDKVYSEKLQMSNINTQNVKIL